MNITDIVRPNNKTSIFPTKPVNKEHILAIGEFISNCTQGRVRVIRKILDKISIPSKWKGKRFLPPKMKAVMSVRDLEPGPELRKM